MLTGISGSNTVRIASTISGLSSAVFAGVGDERRRLAVGAGESGRVGQRLESSGSGFIRVDTVSRLALRAPP